MTVTKSKWQNRKAVSGRNKTELDKFVKQHEARGWKKVGKGVEIHGAYKTEYIQVMEFGRLVNEVGI
ncbi:hypothetical protein [Ureibacillus sinduriensis]|uniref:Uncharacterized protein n=1 Tax=Ureibacillus sinduriensis BLB-1 = JCM 15800 TaxID=1384057 RepID=A0A0A3IJ39_9BACL|nr:hypothetical protein [Ureibacillus sinduriensis]KGR74877.1 hypothetical protein CD33_14030 [Ureibacillus sinduriensis BLB-1 = JCM 15800]